MSRASWARRGLLVMVLLLLVLAAVPADAASRDVILATTTSTQDSGLLDYLIPLFEEKTGFRVKAIAVGTGQALALGERGEADVLLTHAPAAEEQMAAAGHVVNRRRVMYNDFVVAGPAGDPAGVRGLPVVDSFRRIAEAGAVFVSRGDNSGTHMKELSLWTDAGVNPQGQPWYVETGQGMGRTLSVASERLGYTLTDRGTYLALRHLLGDMEILVEGDSILFNVYHVMQVNPEKSPMINSAGAEAFVAFMVSDEVQAIIADFGVDKYGQPLFVPYAE